MLQIVICPKHGKALIYWKDTATHSIFKCPECDYADYPGVVHQDLPERYMKLEERIKELEGIIREYGGHLQGCDAVKCTCGFNQATKRMQLKVNDMVRNPKQVGSNLWDCRPQTGNCPVGCSQCFYNRPNAFYCDINEPNIPDPVEVGNDIVRMNCGHDSNLQRNLVIATAGQYKNFFFVLLIRAFY